MSYLVLARKYRPMVFDDLVGQKHISETLKKAINSGRVAHAYLFCGTRGVGKTTSARILAKALNCLNGPTPNPCGTCSSCREIAAGSSMDVVEIDGASNRGIDDIRTLRETVQYASMSGRYRVFIIDEVHMVTTPAFNALLKTLEEPPPNVVFIFATTEASRIPQTILSRCQRYDFRRIPLAEIQSQLLGLCKTEGISADVESLFLIARKAEGSMRDALSLLDQVFSFCQNEITLAKVQNILGLVGQEVFERLLSSLAAKDSAACLKIIDDVFASGYDIAEFTAELGEQIRCMMLAKIPGMLSASGAGLSEPSLRFYAEISAHYTDTDLLRMARWVQELAQSVRRSNSPRFEIELCVLRMLQADSTVTISDVLRELRGGEPSAVEPPSRPARPSIAPTSASPVSPPPARSIEVKKPAASPAPAAPAIPTAQGNQPFEWTRFLDEIMRDKPLIGTFLSHARIVAQGPANIELRFPHNSGFQLEQVQRKENLEFVTEKLAQMTGTKPVVRLLLDQKTEVRQAPAKPTETGPKIPTGVRFDDAAEKEPILNRIVELFDGEIMPEAS